MSNISFSQLIHKVDIIESACIRDEIKLRCSGELICNASEQILQKAKNLLEKSQRCLRLASQSQVTQADTQIDRSFSNFLSSFTQQSISTNFLTKYLQPQIRADYQREITISIKFLSATEALDELAEDLIESEIFNLAHDEDISEWSEIVRDYLGQQRKKRVSLVDIVNGTKLNLAKVFLGLLHGEFMLIQTDFYDLTSLWVILGKKI